MDRHTIPTSRMPEVIIEQVDGDLLVKGWDQAEVAINAKPGTFSLQEQDDTVRLSCQGDCEVRLPYEATLQVQAVNGDAHFKLLQDELSIRQVHGSLTLRNVAETHIESVHGDFATRGVSGDLHVVRVHGNASAREVEGACYLEDVNGNLELRDIEMEIKANVDGNFHLRLSEVSGMEYRLQADGNVNCQLPEDASLKLNLNSEGEIIRVSLAEKSQTYRQRTLDLTLGDGEALMSIASGGVIAVSSYKTGRGEGKVAEIDLEAASGGLPGDFSQQIAQQVQAQIASQMEMMTRQMTEQLAGLTEKVNRAGLSPEETEHIMEQARQSSEQATLRAQEKMRRAQEKLERKLEAAQRRSEQKAHHAERHAHRHTRFTWSADWPPAPPIPPQPPKEPISDEERIMILRMLEQKKITLEEAEQLLAALEGNS